MGQHQNNQFPDPWREVRIQGWRAAQRCPLLVPALWETLLQAFALFDSHWGIGAGPESQGRAPPHSLQHSAPK